MTGKVYESDGPNLSLLIIPVAAAIILISKAWPLLLLLIAAVVAWNIYDKIKWLRQCELFNPSFNQLIKENKGILTVLDFSGKTSLSNKLAKNFLERKAQEYGAVRKNVGKEGIVYYFITASALSSIFDESEATEEDLIVTHSPVLPPTTNVLTELAQLKKSQLTVVETPLVEPEVVVEEGKTLEPSITLTPPEQEVGGEITTTPLEPEVTPTTTSPEPEVVGEIKTTPPEPEVVGEIKTTPPEPEVTPTTIPLEPPKTQSELAKRLDISSSIIGKRKLKPDFTEWTQSIDPEGIAWVYIESTKVFIPKNS